VVPTSAHCACVHLLQGGGLAAVADLGGSILTGIDGNPLAVLARQLRIPLHHINSEGVPLYCADGREANRRLDQQARSPAARCDMLSSCCCGCDAAVRPASLPVSALDSALHAARAVSETFVERKQ
jgi:hypothetical protein